MKTFAAVAVVALLVYTVNATPCTDICSAKCALQKESCDLAQIFGNLCATINGACSQSCAAACDCADSCSEECGAEFATCKEAGAEDAGPFASLSVLPCGANLPMCQSTCILKCNFNNLASAADALGGAAAE